MHKGRQNQCLIVVQPIPLEIARRLSKLLIHRVRSSMTMHSIVHTIAIGSASIIFVIGMYVVYDFLHHYIGFVKKAVALGLIGILLMSINIAVI